METFNNLDPKRDYYRDGKRIGIDLSQKLAEEGYEQDWPEEIIMSEDIKKKVDENWNRIYPQ